MNIDILTFAVPLTCYVSLTLASLTSLLLPPLELLIPALEYIFLYTKNLEENVSVILTPYSKHLDLCSCRKAYSAGCVTLYSVSTATDLDVLSLLLTMSSQ